METKLNRRHSISDQIYEALRRMIVRLELKPGHALSEKAIAALFKVSRTPVREAVLRLAEHGLVTVAPQFGTFVAAIDPDDVRQAHFMREHLEVAVALRLCGRHGIDLQPARDLVAEQRAIAPTNDFATFAVLDDRFHAWLFEAAGVGKVWSAIHSRKAHLDRIRSLQVPEPGKIAGVTRQHSGIIAAIAAHDMRATEARVREHIAGALVYMEKLLAEQPELFASIRLSRPRDDARNARSRLA